MAEEGIIRIISQPGIKRDGTRLEGDNYVDGGWVRFQRGLPRKIGGYRAVSKYLREINRALYSYQLDDLTYIHAGAAGKLQRFFLTADGVCSVVSDRTPATLTASADTMWQFDVETTSAAPGLQLVAHAAPNLSNICSSGAGQLFYGSLFGSTAMVPVTLFPAGVDISGGVVALHPYTVAYGADGSVCWSPDCADFTVSGAGAANVTGQKIVRGLPLRGGPGASPSGLLWSVDSLVRMSYVGGTPVFQFDTITSESSLMSSSCIVEFDGVYYWIGTDRFLKFNGVVQEVENLCNRDFFFDNVNFAQRQKIFAFKVPRYGEIWWCYPHGDSDEPNHAIIYNVRENSWYDTPLPDGGRSAALPAAVFQKPIMTGVDPHYALLFGATVKYGGTGGFVVGDVLTIVGGAAITAAQVTVSSVNGSGVITGVSVTQPGEYRVAPGTETQVTGGSGAGVVTLFTDFGFAYKVWIHESGVDKVDELEIAPITSFFETADISLPVQAGQNKAMRVAIIEPDFVQTGDILCSVHGRANARAPEVDGDPATIPEVAGTPGEQIITFKTQRRELRFRFESSSVGGYYEMGHILAHVSPGDGTVLG